MKTSILISALVALSLCLCNATSSLADGTIPAIPANGTGSFSDHMKLWFQAAKPIGDQLRAQVLTNDGTLNPAAQYGLIPQGGMTPSNHFGPITAPTQPSVSKQPLPGQVPTPILQQAEFTEYKGGYSLPGPPNPLMQPIRHFLPDAFPLSYPANPAMLQNTPYHLGGSPVSGSEVFSYALEAAYRNAQEANNPSFHTSQAKLQGSLQQAANSTAASAQGQVNSNIPTMQTALINVANEASAEQPPSQSQSNNSTQKTLNQAVWMVQKMYKAFFLPFALLLVLPGAIATQVISFAKGGFLASSSLDIDSSSPLSGILRSVVAIVLIPATQLMISYSIDVGNSMTYEVTQFINATTVSNWSNQLLQSSDPSQTAQQRAQAAQQESGMNATLRTGFGVIINLLQTGILILTGYQVIMISYLMLMGPIAAAFLAWPEGVGSLFRPVFSSWLQGLTNLVLWKFWWCVILLVMATRIEWLNQMGQYDPKSPFEPMVFIAFSVMLCYVPFMALDFRLNEMVDKLLEKTGANGGGSGAMAS